MGEYIYLFISMIYLLISGMLFWEFSNTRFMYKEYNTIFFSFFK